MPISRPGKRRTKKSVKQFRESWKTPQADWETGKNLQKSVRGKCSPEKKRPKKNQRKQNGVSRGGEARESAEELGRHQKNVKTKLFGTFGQIRVGGSEKSEITKEAGARAKKRHQHGIVRVGSSPFFVTGKGVVVRGWPHFLKMREG